MKFGKTFEKRLIEDEIPKEWIDSSIHYKQLKKEINNVVEEISKLGLQDVKQHHYYYEFEEADSQKIHPRLVVQQAEGEDSCKKVSIDSLKLNSDMLFFNDLYQQYQQLLRFNALQSQLIFDKISTIAKLIKKLTTEGSKHEHDMYLWRELFNIYMEFKLDTKNSFNIRNLNKFTSHVNELRLIQKSKHAKKNSMHFNEFYQLNIELIKFLSFRNLNSIAITKILKKFDKNTAFESSRNFNKLIMTDSLFNSNIKNGNQDLSINSIEQVISTNVLSIVPQLDDYTCPICFTLAYKPVRLNCGHFFCIRCLIGLQRRRENKCPMCRAEVVLKAEQVDDELMAFMKIHFPKEVKQKQRQNEKEATDELMMGLYGGEKCVIM